MGYKAQDLQSRDTFIHTSNEAYGHLTGRQDYGMAWRTAFLDNMLPTYLCLAYDDARCSMILRCWFIGMDGHDVGNISSAMFLTFILCISLLIHGALTSHLIELSIHQLIRSRRCSLRSCSPQP
ncbi:hypothetical protein BDZ45DRAFT_311683 [Acephala macrosclerotiorum]|nr:hypothetical protein BDZ45DRAFT_311683 [Acephala macrosclerotiorum]